MLRNPYKSTFHEKSSTILTCAQSTSSMVLTDVPAIAVQLNSFNEANNLVLC